MIKLPVKSEFSNLLDKWLVYDANDEIIFTELFDKQDDAKQIVSALNAQQETCKWTYDEWHDCWDTECGNAYQVTEGTPKENNMKFCPYCGKALVEEKKEESQ